MESHPKLGSLPQMTSHCFCRGTAGPKCLGTRPQPGAPISETSLFPQCSGKHPAWLIRASPGAAAIRESKEKSNSWDFCCLSAPTHPRTVSTRKPWGWAGAAPALPRTPGTRSLTGQKGGKFTQTAVVQTQRPKATEIWDAS